MPVSRLPGTSSRRPSSSGPDGTPSTAGTPQPSADGLSAAPTTSGSRAAEAAIQWQDEFLNLLVRTARSVKRWLKEVDDRADPPERARDSASDLRLPPDLRNLSDLSSVELGSDLYDRTSARLDELLNQSPALKRLAASGQLDVVSNRLSRLRIDDRFRVAIQRTSSTPPAPSDPLAASAGMGTSRAPTEITAPGSTPAVSPRPPRRPRMSGPARRSKASHGCSP
ncbi:hypothetical protein NKG94_02730 [Micromonospora sp. M12]